VTKTFAPLRRAFLVYKLPEYLAFVNPENYENKPENEVIPEIFFRFLAVLSLFGKTKKPLLGFFPERGFTKGREISLR
jgi:hypothetical protein